MKQARNTTAKTEILDLISQSEVALSHSEIQSALDGLCDRVTIYRVLDRLVEEDLVHKLWILTVVWSMQVVIVVPQLTTIITYILAVKSVSRLLVWKMLSRHLSCRRSIKSAKWILRFPEFVRSVRKSVFVSRKFEVCTVVIHLPVTVSGFAFGRDLLQKSSALHQCQIYNKKPKFTHQPAYCQYDVSGSVLFQYLFVLSIHYKFHCLQLWIITFPNNTVWLFGCQILLCLIF